MRLFVSYARADKAVADALVGDLHSLGHEAFYDRDLTGGQKWWDALLDRIQDSHAFMPILSDNYRDSQACRAEAEWADSITAPFLPVVIGHQLPGMYDPMIAEANWITYDPHSRTALAELSRGVSSVTAFSLPSSLPARPAIPLSYLVMLEREIRGEGDVSRQRQLTITSDLRSKLGTREDAGARELLLALRSRPDVTYETATTIESLLATPQEGRRVEPLVAPEIRPKRAEPKASPVTAPVSKEPDPAPLQPPESEPAGSPASSRHAARIAAVAAIVVSLTTLAGPWATAQSSLYRTHSLTLAELIDTRVPSGYGGIIRWLAALGLAAAVALSVLCIVRVLSRVQRTIIAAVDVVAAACCVFFVESFAGSENFSVSWGPFLTAAALVSLAVVAVNPRLAYASTQR